MDGRWKRLIRRCTAISCLTQHHAVLFTVLLLLGLVNEITDAIINKRSFGLKINHKQHRCDLQLKADSYLNLVRIRSAWGLAWRIQCRCQMLFFCGEETPASSRRRGDSYRQSEMYNVTVNKFNTSTQKSRHHEGCWVELMWNALYIRMHHPQWTREWVDAVLYDTMFFIFCNHEKRVFFQKKLENGPFFKKVEKRSFFWASRSK